MRSLMLWLPPVATHEIYVIPAWAPHRGARRLEAAAEVVGGEEAKRIARKLGAYELSAPLAHELRLAGLELNPKGEVPALSPAAWLRSSALRPRPIPEWREALRRERFALAGLMIHGRARDGLLRFLKANRHEPADAWELLELADHFLQADVHQLLVRAANSAEPC